YGQLTKFIELAGEVNTAMPLHVVNRTAEALNAVCKPVNGSRVLLVGLAYKANVDDMRESPTFILMDELKRRGARVAYYDPFIPASTPAREHGHWTGMKSIVWTREQVKDFDAVIIATAHDGVDYRQLTDWADVIVDTRNALAGIPTREGQVWKA